MASKKDAEQDPRVTKRRVTMRSVTLAPEPDKNGNPVVQTAEKIDYVRPDFLDAYLTAARAVWQQVSVSDEPDAGPGGYDAPTYIPATYPVTEADGTVRRVPFPHPAAGSYYPASDCGPDCTHAPTGSKVVA